jgi:hypothetical protein
MFSHSLFRLEIISFVVQKLCKNFDRHIFWKAQIKLKTWICFLKEWDFRIMPHWIWSLKWLIIHTLTNHRNWVNFLVKSICNWVLRGHASLVKRIWTPSFITPWDSINLRLIPGRQARWPLTLCVCNQWAMTQFHRASRPKGNLKCLAGENEVRNVVSHPLSDRLSSLWERIWRLAVIKNKSHSLVKWLPIGWLPFDMGSID